MTTVGELLRAAAASLEASTSPRLDAELLLAQVLETDRAGLYRMSGDAVLESRIQAFERLVARRRAGEPVPYLISCCEFFGLELFVDARVLVPRPETERLVEEVLARAPPAGTVVDLGTGSGAVALAIASQRPDLKVIASDRSDAALAVARINRDRLGFDNIAFACGDWLEPVGTGRADVICSNPPYVASGDAAMADATLGFEPSTALDGGADGLDAIRTIAAGVVARLRPGGSVVLEHGWDQGTAVRRLLAAAGLGTVATVQDLAGRDRITSGCRER